MVFKPDEEWQSYGHLFVLVCIMVDKLFPCQELKRTELKSEIKYCLN